MGGAPEPKPPAEFVVAIDALNGFAAAPPVSWGLNPTPSLDVVEFPTGLTGLAKDPVMLPLAPAFMAPNPPRVPPNPPCCLFSVPNSEVPNGEEPNPPAPVPGPIVFALEPAAVVGLVGPC